ncbi:MAG: hypothetical protein AAFU85_03020 [Planctomycetota bacterium]
MSSLYAVAIRRLLLLAMSSLASVSSAKAEVIGFLDGVRDIGGERFQSDFFLAGTSARIGDDIELITLDVINSQVAGTALADFTRVTFDASPTFVPWQAAEQFGVTPGFESQILLDAFAPGAVVFTLADTNPFRVGTLTFDYSNLGLQTGETITLDIVGVSDGSATLTTSVAVRDNPSGVTELLNPNFSTALGSGQIAFTVSAIPEPSGAVMCLMAFSLGLAGRRRRR